MSGFWKGGIFQMNVEVSGDNQLAVVGEEVTLKTENSENKAGDRELREKGWQQRRGARQVEVRTVNSPLEEQEKQ